MNGTNNKVLAILAVTAVGCTNPAPRSSSSGSLALSSDDALLYAADTDNGLLAVIDTKSNTVLSTVKVGDAPFRVAVAADDTVYVANRGSLDVSVIRRGDWKEASRLALNAEPVGLQASQDGKTLFVVTATTQDKAEVGALTAIDTATQQVKGSVEVGNEPRGLALVGDRAVISLYKRGELVEVDTRSLTVQANGEEQRPIYHAANLSKLTGATAGTIGPAPSSFRFRGLSDVVATPDGSRLFVPAVLAREDQIGRLPSAGGYYGGGGPCNVGAVASAGILTLNVNGNAGAGKTALDPKVDDLTKCVSSGTNDSSPDFPTTTLSPRVVGSASSSDPIQGPTVAAVDPTGSWLYVVNRETSNLAVMPTDRRTGDDLHFSVTGNSVRSVTPVGAGADGIALTKDGLKAYVYSQFDHRVDIVTTSNDGQDKSTAAQLQTSSSPISVASDPPALTADLSAGRRLYFDAVDSRLSAPGTNVSCNTCHLEGTDDQHVWGFPDGERQTPTLAGRHLLATAPYHWSGEFPSLQEFMDHTIRERMGGSGLGSVTLAQYMANYIESLPAPSNPYKKVVPADQVVRGGQAFSKAGCDGCHAGANFTDNSNRDVGTLVTGGTEADNGYVLTAVNGTQPGFNVPSLLGVARSGPYLHTGAEDTLEARVNDTDTAHGNLGVLSAQEKADLVAFLKTL